MKSYPSIKLRIAAQIIKAGGVIAYPTDTVWGFGCDPNNPDAVARLLALKQRPVDKGLILVAATAQQCGPYLEGLDESLKNKFSQPTGTPTTWLVPDNGYAKGWIKGDFTSVALRVSTNKQLVALCSAVGGPIVSSSANIAGQPTRQWPWLLRRYVGNGLDYILPGHLSPNSKPSQIRDLISDKVFRAT